MTKKILIHTCCAPCFIMPYTKLKDDYEITAFWYNHNIHPYQEYKKRYETFKTFVNNEGIKSIVKNEYGLIPFLQKTVFEEEKRCYNCYYQRLDETAILAKKEGFDFFTTSLLYSKRQNHEKIKEIAFYLANINGINFLYQDWREFWKEGIDISVEKDMYRQKYCGCIYSEMERK